MKPVITLTGQLILLIRKTMLAKSRSVVERHFKSLNILLGAVLASILFIHRLGLRPLLAFGMTPKGKITNTLDRRSDLA
jgi:hypothetical protein